MATKSLENGAEEHAKAYEWLSAAVTVTGTGGADDITDETGFGTLFGTVPRAHRISIKTSATAYFRLNGSSNDKITVTATTPFTSDYTIVDKLYVSTGGAAVTITVQLT